MPDDNTYSGAIVMTPPLTAVEMRGMPPLRDLRLRVVETTVETDDGEVITRVADGVQVVHGSWDARHLKDDLRALIAYVDGLPGSHSFAGYIEVQWDPGYGLTPPSRYVVCGGQVVEVKAEIVWPGEPDATLTEARDLAKLLISILEQFPTCMDEFDASLDMERLPQWAGGEAETWQRDDEGVSA